MKNIVKINLLDSSFTIQVEDDPEYVNKIIAYADERIKKIQSSITGNPLRVALLACIFIIDELFKERYHSEREREKVAEITRQLISSIDSAIDE